MHEPTLGIIEGFYGQPWSPEIRLDQLTWAAAHGYHTYVYAPKNDPLHRERWRDPYPREQLEHFAALADSEVRVGWAVSPGLSFDHDDPTDLAALLGKLDQLVDCGIDLLYLALDDIAVRPGLGTDHVTLVRSVLEHLGDTASLALVPTDYTSTRSTPYLDALAQGVPATVPIAWTGPTVVCDEITVANARARAAVLGQPPLLWDNHPVNDGLMVDRLFLSPLSGRAPELRGALAGYLANPMPQALASRPALASAAAWWRGDDPVTGWAEEVDTTGIRTLAEGCDGQEPRRLLEALTQADERWQEAAGDLARWVQAAAQVSPDALDGEAQPWVTQLRAEAEVARLALRTLQLARPVVVGPDPTLMAPPDLRAAVEHAMALLATWQQARRGAVSVLGPRASVRAVLSQHPSGEWRYHREALEEGHNALDALVHVVLDVVADLDEEAPHTVLVNGTAVAPAPVRAQAPDVAGAHSREPAHDEVLVVPAPSAATIEVTWSGTATTCVLPATPPLPDRRLQRAAPEPDDGLSSQRT